MVNHQMKISAISCLKVTVARPSQLVTAPIGEGEEKMPKKKNEDDLAER